MMTRICNSSWGLSKQCMKSKWVADNPPLGAQTQGHKVNCQIYVNTRLDLILKMFLPPTQFSLKGERKQCGHLGFSVGKEASQGRFFSWIPTAPSGGIPEFSSRFLQNVFQPEHLMPVSVPGAALGGSAPGIQRDPPSSIELTFQGSRAT